MQWNLWFELTLSVTFPGFIFLQSELDDKECHFETIFIQYAGPHLLPNMLYGSISVRRFIELPTFFNIVYETEF